MVGIVDAQPIATCDQVTRPMLNTIKLKNPDQLSWLLQMSSLSTLGVLGI